MKTKKNILINYCILVGIIILIICACFAFHNIYKIMQNKKLDVSPLAVNEVTYDDLKNATLDIKADTFLVISYTSDEKVYNSEKESKKLLEKYNLIDNVVYLNVSEQMLDDNFINDLNKILKLKNDDKITTLPAILYYTDNGLEKVIDSKDDLINKDDFEEIINEYELAS